MRRRAAGRMALAVPPPCRSAAWRKCPTRALRLVLALAAPGLILVPCARAQLSRDSLAASDSSTTRRVVREFPIEVRALLHDLRSSETVHPIGTQALRSYPVDGLAGVVALQPGVVAQAGELHVRGGRAGETLVELEGMTLNEPLRHRPMELPLLAVRSADLISGGAEARYPGSLAGILDVHTEDPTRHPSGAFQWQTNGGIEGHYDRVSGRVSMPSPWLGLGVVAAGDVTLDDAALPDLRTHARHDVAGLSFGWRAENRMLGYLKLAPVESPRRFSLQLLASRGVHEPYNPMWSLDGWTGADVFGNPVFSDDSLPGYQRYLAADHLAMTDDRQLATLLTASRLRAASRASVALGWLRTRTATTVGGGHGITPGADPIIPTNTFYVIAGDDPLSRVGGSDHYTLRGDMDRVMGKSSIAAGAGVGYQHVWQDELDQFVTTQNIDRERRYDATAPEGFLYGQGRWETGGMVLNGGLRAEYYTAGPQGDQQTLPGSSQGVFSLSPQFGIAFPVSTRDVLSVSYSRVRQDPQRDLLYDRREVITNRQPLGNPALERSRLISYEGAVKHLFSATWALQTSFFYRDATFLAGARSDTLAGGTVNLIYTDQDQASAAGFEVSVIHSPHDHLRLEAHYAMLHAWGFESRPEGDPYGPLRGPKTAPIGERPLSWDRLHSIQFAGAYQWRYVVLGWSSVVASALPWTPKTLRQPFDDVGAVNSRRFDWTETTNLSLRVTPPYALGLEFGFEARNLFGSRGDAFATLDGYPNPVINTTYDDYGAHRTDTGQGGGAYWGNVGGVDQWIEVHDPRLRYAPRSLRASIGRRW